MAFSLYSASGHQFFKQSSQLLRIVPYNTTGSVQIVSHFLVSVVFVTEFVLFVQMGQGFVVGAVELWKTRQSFAQPGEQGTRV